MNETKLYKHLPFSTMKERGWAIIPWTVGRKDHHEAMNWLLNNGVGDFYYSAEPMKSNWCLVIQDKNIASLFSDTFKSATC